MFGQERRIVQDTNYTLTSESSTPDDLVKNIRSFLDRNNVTLVGPFTMRVRHVESQTQRSLTSRLLLEAELTAAAPPTPDHTPRCSEIRAASVQRDSRRLFQLTSAPQFCRTSLNSPISGDTLSISATSPTPLSDLFSPPITDGISALFNANAPTPALFSPRSTQEASESLNHGSFSLVPGGPLRDCSSSPSAPAVDMNYWPIADFDLPDNDFGDTVSLEFNTPAMNVIDDVSVSSSTSPAACTFDISTLVVDSLASSLSPPFPRFDPAPSVTRGLSSKAHRTVVVASKTILREDYHQYLEAELPRWITDGLCKQPEPLRSTVASSGYRDLELAYSNVCQLDMRMGDDVIRSRMALIRLHLEYLRACESGRAQRDTGRQSSEIGRGDASVVIDDILQGIHQAWDSLDDAGRSALRAKFHDRKRYGKRWSVLADALGPSILLLCSKRLAHMIGNTTVTAKMLEAIAHRVQSHHRDTAGVLQAVNPLADKLFRDYNNCSRYRFISQP